jgi:hypothetical protein
MRILLSSIIVTEVLKIYLEFPMYMIDVGILPRIAKLLSRDRVTIDGFWIDDRTYWTL